MTNWYGWAGSILNVDLTNMKIAREPLSLDFATKYIGGGGFATRILYDEVGPEVDPLEPENILVIGQGPLSGTIAPASGRYDLITKSPLKSLHIRSNGGGFFGPEMKLAGYDLIVIRGRAEKPVYLWVDGEHVEIRSAGHIWGKDAWTTQRMIREEVDDPSIQVLKVGPAGENMCYSSCVTSNLGRAAGRLSVAAVWGSKNLKAVAVRGNSWVSVAKPKEFMELCQALINRAKKDPMYAIHTKYGTVGWVGGTTGKRASKETDPLHAENFDELFDKNLSCFGCTYHCSHFYTVKSGQYKGASGEGPESGGGQSVAEAVRVYDPAFACNVNTVCNQLGINTHSIRTSLPWAMRLYEDGIITKEDTDGLELTWGNEEVVLKLIHKIAYKEGFGAILDDPVRGAEMLGRGTEEYIGRIRGVSTGTDSVTIGRLGDLRSVLSDSVISGRGPQSQTIPGRRKEYPDENLRKLGQERYNDPEAFFRQNEPDPLKALEVYTNEDGHAICDLTGTCTFASEQTFHTEGIHPPDFVQLLSLATGVDFTLDDLMAATHRKCLLERAFNAREGVRRIDQYPYPLHYQLKYGKEHPRYDYSTFKFSMEDYDQVLDEYYRLRGCDLETGIPTREKLESLELNDVADDLARRGILPK